MIWNWTKIFSKKIQNLLCFLHLNPVTIFSFSVWFSILTPKEKNLQIWYVDKTLVVCKLSFGYFFFVFLDCGVSQPNSSFPTLLWLLRLTSHLTASRKQPLNFKDWPNTAQGYDEYDNTKKRPRKVLLDRHTGRDTLIPTLTILACPVKMMMIMVMVIWCSTFFEWRCIFLTPLSLCSALHVADVGNLAGLWLPWLIPPLSKRHSVRPKKLHVLYTQYFLELKRTENGDQKNRFYVYDVYRFHLIF